MTTVPIVETDRLTRMFTTAGGRRITALDSVTLAVEQGEVVGLLGPNGAGKTTLSRILTTLLVPSSGTAHIAGHDVVREPKEVRRRIGLVLGGDRGLYGRLTARQNLLYWAALQRLSSRAARQRTDDLLERLGLTARSEDRVETFSRGMIQRVHLARALIGDPEVLIMDEPTNGMDPHAAAGFRTLVHELRASGTTVLLATHDMHEAQALCSRLALIDRGRVLRWGTAEALLSGLGYARIVTARGVPARVIAEIALLPAQSEAGPDESLIVRPQDEETLSLVLDRLVQARVQQISVEAPGLTEVYRSIIEDRELTV
ncbi:MAG: hypothetical protein JWN03_1005 [Nocardia sp.]|uniref:ABC transporter ATP-binding protein n=1 Tax=Nocardia sp. TaxID=1821 RepID=UPI0026340517|nr:ABC transporter ATP-binding protein [Nocardia sp.]MCU1640730.1 hypothetical protein [Nocardia sp.]